MELHKLQKRKTMAAAISVVSNSLLVVFKLAAGITMGSVSVISEAIHSGVDLFAACIALFSVRASEQPVDKEHPYGHGKIENISGSIEALLIFLAGGWIIYEAVQKLMHPQVVESLGWGFLVMLFSTLVNIGVSQMLFRVGKSTESVALLADAWHLRTDVYTSAGVMTGLGIIQAGLWFWPNANLLWLDPLVAIGVAVLILKAAYHLTVEAGRDLLDAKLPDMEEAWIRELVIRFAPNVRGFHRLRTRKAGSMRFIDFHLYVDKDMSVDKAHHISHVIADEIRNHFDRASVTIHIEPCPGDCHGGCTHECEMRDMPHATPKL
ncbi:MAG TPA: cation diffusion facilitator family transporter [Candidatus Hydrogenedentes bacterium]|nr:cation diffusion facilitator family transporter [Candidatus Hydrogenedentota bacterium]